MNRLAEALCDQVPGARADEISVPPTVLVPAAGWRDAAHTAQAAGATRCEWLTAVDLPQGLRVAMLLRGGDDEVIVAADLPAESIVSVASVWPSAVWQERECAELFGIDFPGHPGLSPLLLAASPVRAPLRRRFPLAARVQRTWPGAASASEAGSGSGGVGGSVGGSAGRDSRPAQGRRAAGLAPGVLREWVEGAHE